MFCLPPRFDVQIGIVARYCLGLHGIVLVVGRQLLQLIEHLLADEVALLHPSHLTGRGPHLHEAAIVIEHLHAVAVFHDPRSLVDGGNAVAQVDLHSRNVVNFKHASAAMLAANERGDAGRTDDGQSRTEQEFGEELHGISA